MLNNILFYVNPRVVCRWFVWRWAFGSLLLPPGSWESGRCEPGVHTSCDPALGSVECTLRGGVVGSSGNSICNFLRNSHTFFHRGSNNTYIVYFKSAVPREL